jgi:photosynthetic reaction center cytochrome c subunit
MSDVTQAPKATAAGRHAIGGRALLALAAVCALAACERPPIEPEQQGYRGTGMVQMNNPRTVAKLRAANQAPQAQPPADPSGPKAAQAYKNVQVLKELSVGEFTRTMLAITSWVAPQEGCAYCHAGADFASDDLYTKVVARRMLQMTRHINSEWQAHVAQTGVTCYTCHRGQHVPANVWFTDPGPKTARGMAGSRGEQNVPTMAVALASLPYDPFTPFLKGDNGIRVETRSALPADNRHSIQQTEWTYGLMMHLSQSLGVNCTFCHNSRHFSDWEQSNPRRVTAWHGIRMVRDLNNAYLEPLGPTYPQQRLGPLGDAPKANCATCHHGVQKPLYGVSMLEEYPELATSGQPMRVPSTTQ